MNDLFSEIQSRRALKTFRDTKGRFANKITSESDINRRKAKVYKNISLLQNISCFCKYLYVYLHYD